jgi:hypothetical protein
MFVRSKPSERPQAPPSRKLLPRRPQGQTRGPLRLGPARPPQGPGDIDGIVTSLSRFAVKARLAEKHKDYRPSAGRVARTQR